jgi:hypothetical protein
MRNASGWSFLFAVLALNLAVSPGTEDPSPEKAAPTTEAASAAVRRAGDRLRPEADPFAELTADRLINTLKQLTAIGDHNGWRHSTSRGETEAIAFVEKQLSRLGFLQSLGIELEKQEFRTFMGIEFHRSTVHLVVDGQEFEIPADAVPGDRERLDLALRFDSDGVLNDTRPDPVIVEGAPLIVRTAAAVEALSTAGVAGRIVLLDYTAIDRVINDPAEAIETAWRLAELQPAGIVMVTTYSNRRGLSHGSFSSDLPAFTWVEVDPLPPILLVRLEDMEPAGIRTWAECSTIDSVRLEWDADILSPGSSALLMARIPGLDHTRAVILGAHIDSHNTPGALDNGSGSTTLIEVARALDRSRTVPPVDLHLVWFGSHERGLYGSANFAVAHSELIDRSLAMLQMDCLGRPVDDIENFITLESWPYGRFGDPRTTWPNYLEVAALGRGIATEPVAYYGQVSDNSNFNAFDLPNANLIYMNPYDIFEVHYDNHLHDPYDTVELAEEVDDVFARMAEVMLVAALRTAEDEPDLRVTPEPDHRALLVGSHTEAVHMQGASFNEFGMAMAWEGFDLDAVPYGKHLAAANLADTDLVVALPVHDYPSPDGDVGLYDEAWTTVEIDAIEDWVRDGGTLVLTNSAHRLKYVNYVYEVNEDWQDANDLAERFGITFSSGGISGSTANVTTGHPLMAGVTGLQLASNNGVRYTTEDGQDLAWAGSQRAVSVVPAGLGEVVVLADLGILGSDGGEPQNLQFWRNLAQYARNR